MLSNLTLFLNILFSIIHDNGGKSHINSTTTLKQIDDKISLYHSKAEKAKGVEQYDSLFYFANKGYELTLKTPQKSFLPFYYYYSSMYYSHYKNYNKAIDLAQEGIKLALQSKNYLLFEKISYLRALIFLEMGNKRAVVNQIFHNIRHSTKFIKNSGTSAANFLLLSNLYYQIGEDSLWAHYLNKYIIYANRYYKDNKPPIVQETDAFVQLELSIYNNNTKEASKLLTEIQRIHQLYKLPHANHYINLIITLNVASRFHNEKLIPRILSMIEPKQLVKSVDSTRIATYYYHLAAVNVRNNNYTKARTYIDKCYKTCRSIAKIMPLVLETELQILEQEGRYKEAVQVYKETLLIAAAQTKNIKEIELATLEQRLADDYQALKVSSIQQKLKIQYLENINKKEQLQSANKKIIAISVILIILLILIIVYWSLAMKLRTQTKKLALLLENKDRLFSIIGHDLRGPIVSVLSLSTHTQSDGYTFILNQQKYLKSLLFTVDNLLQWSLSQQEKITPKAIDINVIDVVEEVLEELDAFIHLSDVDIQVSYDNSSNTIIFDEYHLKIIIRNILHNAIKHTPPKGHIYISTIHTDCLHLIIQDTGRGIGSSVQNINTRSTKIGLEIVKTLIDLNNASLIIDSKLGIGTSVKIVFEN